MKKRLAGFAATGAMALAALTGAVGTANAAVAHPAVTIPPAVIVHPAASYYYGPFATEQDCVNFVASVGELGVYDCEYYNSAPPGHTFPGWYASTPW